MKLYCLSFNVKHSGDTEMKSNVWQFKDIVSANISLENCVSTFVDDETARKKRGSAAYSVVWGYVFDGDATDENKMKTAEIKCNNANLSYKDTPILNASVFSIEVDDKSVVKDGGVYDDVDHPAHYTSGGIECIDAMRAAYGIEIVKHFCLGNAFKYQFRCLNKDNTNKDLMKANWYNKKYVELEKESEQA